jgi:hypothetical protein
MATILREWERDLANWERERPFDYLAALALRAYPDEESKQRRCVEWAATRLRSLLVGARPTWRWGEKAPAWTMCRRWRSGWGGRGRRVGRRGERGGGRRGSGGAGAVGGRPRWG